MALPFCTALSARNEIKQYSVMMFSSEIKLILMQQKQGNYEYYWGFVHLHQ